MASEGNPNQTVEKFPCLSHVNSTNLLKHFSNKGGGGVRMRDPVNETYIAPKK